MPEVAVKALAEIAEARKLLETPGNESAVVRIGVECCGTLHTCIREFDQAVENKKIIEKNTRTKDEQKYSAFFGKCNHKSCRKAKKDHFGNDNQCFDPQVLVAAVESHRNAVKVLETLKEGLKSFEQTYDAAREVLYKIAEEGLGMCQEKEAQGQLQEAIQHAERAMEVYMTLRSISEVNWCSKRIERLKHSLNVIVCRAAYECPVCSQRFGRQNALDRHLRDKQDGAHLKHRSSAPDGRRGTRLELWNQQLS
jgi:hypothetical protein